MTSTSLAPDGVHVDLEITENPNGQDEEAAKLLYVVDALFELVEEIRANPEAFSCSQAAVDDLEAAVRTGMRVADTLGDDPPSEPLQEGLHVLDDELLAEVHETIVPLVEANVTLDVPEPGESP